MNENLANVMLALYEIDGACGELADLQETLRYLEKLLGEAKTNWENHLSEIREGFSTQDSVQPQSLGIKSGSVTFCLADPPATDSTLLKLFKPGTTVSLDLKKNSITYNLTESQLSWLLGQMPFPSSVSTEASDQ